MPGPPPRAMAPSARAGHSSSAFLPATPTRNLQQLQENGSDCCWFQRRLKTTAPAAKGRGRRTRQRKPLKTNTASELRLPAPLRQAGLGLRPRFSPGPLRSLPAPSPALDSDKPQPHGCCHQPSKPPAACLGTTGPAFACQPSLTCPEPPAPGHAGAGRGRWEGPQGQELHGLEGQ